MALIDSHIWNEEHNCFVSDSHRRVAEIINDYDSELFLAFVPPQLRELDEQYPFALIHSPQGKPQYVVWKLKESEINEQLLARIWSSDNLKHDVLGRIEALDAARHAMKLHAEMEAREEANEIGASILKSPLHTYKHNGKKYT